MKRWISQVSDLLRAVLEGCLDSVVEEIGEFVGLGASEGISIEGRFDGEDTHDIRREALEVLHGMMRVNEDTPSIIERIHHIHLDTLTHEGVATALVDDFTLGVHHIVVLE